MAEKAWECWPYGWNWAERYIEHAHTRGQARARSARRAQEAGFAIRMIDIRAVRVREPPRDEREASRG